MGDELYYIRDMRDIVGNSLTWWRPNGNGYTCNLDEAWQVTKKEFKPWRETDVLYPVNVMDDIAQRHVDIQDLNRLDESPPTEREVKP